MQKLTSRRKRSGITLGSTGVAVVIGVIPLMKGGLVTATLPVLCVIVGLAFLAESYRFLFHKEKTLRNASPWIYVWLGVTLYIVGQPAIREIFHLELTINGVSFTRVYWLQHIKYWSFFTAYWLLAWVVSRQHGNSRSLIVITVISMAVFQSLYGTIAFVNGQETILGIWPKTDYRSSVTGTFHNYNHLAGFLALAMPLGASYLMSSRRMTSTKLPSFSKLFVTVIFLLTAGVALTGTASRMGVFSAVVGFVLWGWLYMKLAHVGKSVRFLWFAIMLLLLLLGSLWFGPDRLLDRLLRISESTGRFEIWKAMLGVSWSVWLQGIGAGSFHDVFKLVHPVGYVDSVWRAHNEYLQLLFEFGLIGVLLLMPVLIYWMRKCWCGELHSLERGALAGTIAILVHNIADFDTQVPGTATLFWVAVGILFSGPGRNSTGEVKPHLGPVEGWVAERRGM